MKKITSFLGIMLIALCLMFSACNGCNNSNNPSVPEVDTTGYNYDEVVIADYDYIASQYAWFNFYEADVVFDTAVAVPDAHIVAIQTVFQINDTCILIRHNEDMTTDTVIVNDYWMECMPMNAYNAVDFDSCMVIIEPYRSALNNRRMTFRRVLAPHFPENGQYIFGPGLLVVDAATGAIVDWNDTDTVMLNAMNGMIDSTRIGTPLGEWP